MQIVIAKNILKCLVHTRLIGHFSVMSTAFVNDLQRNAIVDGLAYCIFVDVIAKDLFSLVYFGVPV